MYVLTVISLEANCFSGSPCLGRDAPLRWVVKSAISPQNKGIPGPAIPKPAGWLALSPSDNAYLAVSGPPGVSESHQVGKVASPTRQTWVDKLCAQQRWGSRGDGAPSGYWVQLGKQHQQTVPQSLHLWKACNRGPYFQVFPAFLWGLNELTHTCKVREHSGHTVSVQ